MQLIPAVDVLGGQVVRLVEGDYNRVTVYADDPVAQAARWVADGAALVHVVDLEGARDGEFNEGLWRGLAEAGVPFQVGGGIRGRDAAEHAIASGAARVVMGTAAVWHPHIVAGVVEAVGPARVVAALDVRDGKATGTGWLDEGQDLTSVVERVVAAGVVRVLVTGIGTDGRMTGPDCDVIEEVQRLAPGLAVLGSGGVGSLEDLDLLAQTGVEGAIVGRALYEGEFTVQSAVARLAAR
jgi:phosphoribosylformimino-5-aminoimidazole carboxamide ribotide isomerase